MNSFGKNFRVTIFGESHGSCVGVHVEGFPAGMRVRKDLIQAELARRAPGRHALSTRRREPDRVRILSGVFRGRASGSPIVMTIANKDVDDEPYRALCKIPRPGHADFPAWVKYGDSWDWRGGGQFSGRLTAALVAAGALAKTFISTKNVTIFAHTVQIGNVRVSTQIKGPAVDGIPLSPGVGCRVDPKTGCAFPDLARRMRAEIARAKKAGDSVGGIVECVIRGLPVGLGEPFFDTLDGSIAKMMFAIPAVKAIEFGAGFVCGRMRGSQNNDSYAIEEVNPSVDGLPARARVVSLTNNAGGVLGGMSTGMPVVFRVAIKPTSSIALRQKTVNLESLEEQTIRLKGRHDPCIVPRAVPVIEASTAIVIADFLL